MQDISKELKKAFLTDSKHKRITLRHPATDFSRVNFWDYSESKEDVFYSRVYDDWSLGSSFAPYSGYDPFVRPLKNYLKYAKNCVVDVTVHLSEYSSSTGNTPSYVRIGTTATNRVIKEYYSEWLTFDEVQNGDSWPRVRIEIPNLYHNSANNILNPFYFSFYDENKQPYSSDKKCHVRVYYENPVICLGEDLEAMPYSDTVQVDYLGYDMEFYVPHLYLDKSGTVTNPAIIKESASFYENICPEEQFTLGGCSSAELGLSLMNDTSFDTDDYVQASVSIDGVNDEVPLGIFKIYDAETSGSHSLIKKRLDAYDDMTLLSQEAAQWWKSYVYALNTSEQSGEGFEYTREMFSTLYNALESSGINFKSCFTPVDKQTTDVDYGIYPIKFYFDPENTAEYIQYRRIEFTFPKTGGYFKLNVKVAGDYEAEIKTMLEDPMTQQNGTKKYTDPINSPAGNILISSSDGTKKILVNDGDIFKWESKVFYVYVPYRYVFKYNEQTLTENLTLDYDDVECTQHTFDLFDTANDEIRLVYYDWESKTIANPSNITYRDVVRSLIELTGGFLRYGRNGLLEWVRPQLESIYPSQTLYPSPTLYPRKGPGAQITNDRCRSYKKSGFNAGVFGGIDIIAGLDTAGSNDVALSYTGDVSKANRYVMSDNAFYSQTGVNYAKDFSGNDVVPEATEMLENLYDLISAFSFAPYEAKVCGMPWVECGDRIVVKTGEGYLDSFIWQRNLNGIQLLVDDFEANAEN